MATTTASESRFPTWVGALIPVVLIALLAGIFIALDPIGDLREVPPVESVAFERVAFTDDGITAQLRNDGPDPVTVSQVLVNDAYWDFEIDDRHLARLESTTLRLDYPWEDGLPVTIGLVTETGVVIDHEVEAATLTPPVDAATVGVYALLGLYIGVIPVLIGLLWFPSLARANPRWIAFFLAFTVGLLVFLLIDTVEHGLEIAAQVTAFDGVGTFALGALGAVLVLLWFESWLAKRGTDTRSSGLFAAYLVATGIGLHNLGEGLAVGAALAAGEAALGTFLILGFALHNTTEGLAIVAPLGREKTRPALWHFFALGAVAGLPTIAGSWIGGFAFLPAWGALFFGVAAGAIAQVVWVIGRSMRRDDRTDTGILPLGFLAGLLFMYVTALLVTA